MTELISDNAGFTSVSITLPLLLLCVLHQRLFLWTDIHVPLSPAGCDRGELCLFLLWSRNGRQAPLCHISAFKSVLLSHRISQWQCGLQSTNIYMDGVIFLATISLWHHCDIIVISGFTSEWAVKVKSLSALVCSSDDAACLLQSRESGCYNVMDIKRITAESISVTSDGMREECCRSRVNSYVNIFLLKSLCSSFVVWQLLILTSDSQHETTDLIIRPDI